MNDPARFPASDPSPLPDVARGTSAEIPGVLRGGATLTLQTRQAQRLVKGRPGTAQRPAIIGLIGFATLLRALWHGARADDPYADWWLLRVHEALEGAQAEMTAARAALGLEDAGPITVATAASVKPVRVPLEFSNPYAFRGAWLLATYDALVCALLTARHVGVLTREEAERALHQAGRSARRAFSSPFGYRLTGVTRTDVEQGTAGAQQARARMGELPDDVLEGARRAPHAPAAGSHPPPNGTEALSLKPLIPEAGSPGAPAAD